MKMEAKIVILGTFSLVSDFDLFYFYYLTIYFSYFSILPIEIITLHITNSNYNKKESQVFFSKFLSKVEKYYIIYLGNIFNLILTNLEFSHVRMMTISNVNKLF